MKKIDLSILAAAALLALSTPLANAQTASSDATVRALAEEVERLRAEADRQTALLKEQQKQIDALQSRVVQPVPVQNPVLPKGSALIHTPQAMATPDSTDSEPAPEVVVRGELPGSIKIPGTETSLKIGGYSRLDVVKDLGGGEFGSVALPMLTPFAGSAQASRKGQLSFNARQSRLYVRTLTKTPMGPVGTLVEGDFMGAGGNEGLTNSTAFRLRQAYVEAGPWLAGQAFTNFLDLASFPETLDFAGGQGSIQVVREGQLRYTNFFNGNNQLSIALENPESDVFGTVATTISAAIGPTSTTTLDKAPDVNARYAYSGDWGRITFAGMARYLSFNNNGGAPLNGFTGSSNVLTKQWALQGRLNTFGKDSFQYSFAGGAGIGRYLLGSVGNTAAVLEGGKLHGIQQMGLTASYQHYWSPTIHSNLIYGVVKSDYPRPAVPLTTPDRVQAVFANVIWSPIVNSLIGLEYERAMVSNAAAPTPTLSDRGFNNRLLASFQYGF